MSMNIIYCIDIDKSTYYNDFQFQTPTSLTYKLIALDSKEEQLKLIYEYMLTTDFADDMDYLEVVYGRIVDELSNDNISLTSM